MSAYTKLFSSILDSSIWQEDDHTRLVWITMLAMADQHGEVQASIPGIAKRAGVPLASAEASIEKLMGPDKYSRTPDNEGRRIARIDGGWEILNHAKYRFEASLEDRKEKALERQRRHRKGLQKQVNETPTGCDTALQPVTPRDEALPVTPSHAPVTLFDDKQKQKQKQSQKQITEELFAGTDSGEKKEPKRPRPRNEILDALVSVCGGDPFQTTSDGFNVAASALKSIREVCPNVTREQMQEKAVLYRKKYTTADLTPKALAKHWGSLFADASLSKDELAAKMRSHRGNPNHVEHSLANKQERDEFDEMFQKWKAMP